jgi:hypothetical protein
MAINFPGTPSLNQLFTAGETTYKWNGDSWQSIFVTTNPNISANPRVTTSGTTTGTITPPANSADVFNLFGLTGGITVAIPSGTPVDGQRFIIRLEDDGTPRAITWTTTSGGYRAVGVELPTTTVSGKITYVGLIYNAVDSFWDVTAVSTQA